MERKNIESMICIFFMVILALVCYLNAIAYIFEGGAFINLVAVIMNAVSTIAIIIIGIKLRRD